MNKHELELHESPAVIKHIEILQGIITRMAGNSAACKAWAIPVITGIVAFSIEKQCIPVVVSLIPAVMFFLLDSFYLGLERHFINKQREFVSKLANGTLAIQDIFNIESKRSFWIHLKFMLGGMVSFSTAFVYLPIIVLICCLCIMGY